MSQPTYNDMGKSCKDFFSKGYYFGVFKINVKNQTGNGLETVATGTHKMEDKSALGEFEAKTTLPYGLKMTGKWNTANLLTNKLEMQDKLVQGMKIGVESEYNLDSGAKLAKLNTQYKIDKATIELGLEGGDEANLLVNSSIVLGYRNFLTGYQIAYDTNEGALKKNNVALGYLGNGWMVHTAMDNAETIAASGTYKIGSSLEAGINATYTSGDDSANKVSGGIKYALNGCTAIKAKIDSAASLGVGYEMKMTEGAVITFCTQVDTSNLSAGGHKVGFALEFGG